MTAQDNLVNITTHNHDLNPRRDLLVYGNSFEKFLSIENVVNVFCSTMLIHTTRNIPERNCCVYQEFKKHSIVKSILNPDGFIERQCKVIDIDKCAGAAYDSIQYMNNLGLIDNIQDPNDQACINESFDEFLEKIEYAKNNHYNLVSYRQQSINRELAEKVNSTKLSTFRYFRNCNRMSADIDGIISSECFTCGVRFDMCIESNDIQPFRDVGHIFNGSWNVENVYNLCVTCINNIRDDIGIIDYKLSLNN